MEKQIRDVNIAITAASYSGNKGAAAMLQSSIKQLRDIYGDRLNINLMSVYPGEDRKQNPYDFLKVIPAKPARLIFLVFPLACLYWLLKWIPGMKKLFSKNKVIKAYQNTDLLIDEAGVSFIDSRGFVMNTYAFITMAIPKLVGVPLVKYSQAIGPFDNFWNRFLAKWILPKLELIVARGEITKDNLAKIGLTDNVRLCADGAFTMKDDENYTKMVDKAAAKDSFFSSGEKGIIGLSISSVVDKKCRKLSIDYKAKTVEFIDYLTKNGYRVLIIANAARINSEKPRNNDLIIGDEIYDSVKDKELVRWYHREMDAEEIREYIAKCRIVVASRFHSMIGALEKKVPVLLVGWSHKYLEVLNQFELGKYCIDYKAIGDNTLKNNESFSSFKDGFEAVIADEELIRKNIAAHYDEVMESSAKNIEYISEIIDRILAVRPKKEKLIETRLPERYLGTSYIKCRKGYASDEKIRANAASGGMITAILCSLLEQKKIDGALVTRTVIEDGRLGYKTVIATDAKELMDSSSSIYMYMPLLKEIEQIRSFNGRVAVVLTPCLLKSLNSMLEKDEELKKKIVLKLGLFCSGNHTEDATLFSIEKSGISLENAERLYYRRGLWRGQSSVIYKDGSTKNFSYTKSICAYKNAYYFEKQQCMLCQDQFANAADISFGDIWLKEMKKENIKHTGCIIRTEAGLEMYNAAVEANALKERHMSVSECLRGQKRALVFKYNAAAAKVKYYKKHGKTVSPDTGARCKWNHSLAFKMAEKDRIFSEKHPDKLKKRPLFYIYLKMCFIRVLLSF
ncbi:MAG: polysaccharide pyruvyl transferase family protein [Lachnospiraceae bacterium]|nr:polysaccharide pyruvyl transferase family protein [Lachnospiraceae bacterium]